MTVTLVCAYLSDWHRMRAVLVVVCVFVAAAGFIVDLRTPSSDTLFGRPINLNTGAQTNSVAYGTLFLGVTDIYTLRTHPRVSEPLYRRATGHDCLAWVYCIELGRDVECVAVHGEWGCEVYACDDYECLGHTNGIVVRGLGWSWAANRHLGFVHAK